MRNVVIAGYARSPFTPAKKGELAKVRPDELAAQTIRGLVQRTGVELRLPPGYTLTPEAGGLRAAAYALPAEGVLLHDGLAPEPPRPAAPPKPAAPDKKSEAQVQELVGKLKDGRGARRAGTMPLRVPFSPRAVANRCIRP